MFYILSLLLIVFRLYFYIWFFKITLYFQPIGAASLPLLKCMLGLEQSWIMVELSVRINLSVKQAKKKEVADS